jgi:hypothetical protein
VFCRFLNAKRRISSQNDILCHSDGGTLGIGTPGTLVRVARNSSFPQGLKKLEKVLVRIWNQRPVAAPKLHATFSIAAESNGYKDVESLGRR